MNRNNKIFQIIISIVALGIAFLLLLCIGICSPKTVVRPAVVDEEACPVPPEFLATLPDLPGSAAPTYIIPNKDAFIFYICSPDEDAFFVERLLNEYRPGPYRSVSITEGFFEGSVFRYYTYAYDTLLIDYTLRSVKTPVTPRPPDAYNKQLQSYIYYSRANESDTDILQLSAVTGLFILNIIMICNLVYIIERSSRR